MLTFLFMSVFGMLAFAFAGLIAIPAILFGMFIWLVTLPFRLFFGLIFGFGMLVMRACIDEKKPPVEATGG